MDFKNAKELLELCQKQNLPISRIMLNREITEGEMPEEEALSRMARALEIMKESARTPIKTPVRSMGGLIGGEAGKLAAHQAASRNILGEVLEKAITCAVAVLETNASMGLIVAAPTAGSAGVVPGMLLSLQECHHFSDEDLVKALFNAGAIGYLAMRNATVAGAVGGCQAEVGAASGMAAAALVDIKGGTAEQCAEAFAMALTNLEGLVCDPVAGLVEIPCIKRNVIGAMNAVSAADMALAGVVGHIPADEVIDAMAEVGNAMSKDLRETGIGGLAGTPTGRAICEIVTMDNGEEED